MIPQILEAEKMTPAMARYWNSQAQKLAGKVSFIDPFRRPLKMRREQGLKGLCYRASTGGKWGKSAETVSF